MELNRRTLLTLGASAAALAAGRPFAGLAQAEALAWRNWSGLQHCEPEERLAPGDVAELGDILKNAPRPIRPVGAGHSFTPLVPTDGTVLSLDRLQGILTVDEARKEATFGGGTRLGAIGRALEEKGQALINMPDINKQTLAGSISTATHGTGLGFNALSAYVRGLELVTAKGEVLTCSADENAEIFEAARVSLGALGIITKITMENRAPYRLTRRVWSVPFDEMMEQAEELAEQHRNFEFYYIPFSGMCLGITHDETDAEINPRASTDDDDAVMTLKALQEWLGWAPSLREYLIRSEMEKLPDDIYVDTSWRIYPSERGVRFNEMEYHLPRAAGLTALKDVRETIETNNLDVFFPIEFRYVKGDDLWLSPFTGRDSCSIAVHRYYEEDHTPYFKAMEPIFRKHDGRPHWGKLHTLGAADFAALYPRFKDFQEVRAALDPEGVFLNNHLRHVLGVA
ncbi:D-arabinono-1,4-lactone oxidase [Tepidicaulis sp. LMO-SS28]|uniref:D-arabinono-1,4-lactone oxidase n=1 Tax=Tepidicaulis sp. LMO-SS28 TaxID=3447455 RepID=UPI003EDF9D08